MADTLGVDVVDGFCELPQQLLRFALVDAMLRLDELLQVAPRGVFHDQVDL